MQTNWFPVLLALLVAAAGCAEKSSPGADDVEDPVLPPEPPVEPPVNTTVVETPVVDNETRTNFLMTDCINPRMLFILDPEVAQAMLPPGFEAADVTGLTQFTGLPFGSPAEAGQGVGGYDFLSCTSNSLDGGPAAFSQVGIMVKAPDLGNRTPVGGTMYDLYLLGFYANSPVWMDLLAKANFTEAEARQATITSSAIDQAAGNYLGSGSVTAGDALAAADYAIPSAGRDILVDARYWHVAENGTFYIDFHLSENVRAGTVNSCSHAAGSVYERVAGTTTCAQESRFAAVGIGTEVAGTAYWLPRIFPTVA